MSDYTEDWHGQEAREEAESRTRGEAVSTADDAYSEWVNSPEQEFKTNHDLASFMAGAAWALEDAADAWPEVEWKIPVVDEWLRELATGVAGNDD